MADVYVKVALTVLAIVLALFYWPVVCMDAWEWFVMPTFGAPAIGYWDAFWVLFVTRMFIGGESGGADSEASLITIGVGSASKPLVAHLLIWVLA